MPGDDNSENADASHKNEINFNDQEKEWLVHAEENYSKRKFDACLKCIQNLQASFQKNYQSSKIYTNLETKLSMNKSLCDLAISNFENLSEFKQDLNKICTQIKLDLTKLDTLEDLQHSFIFYNYSILLYYNKQYTTAFKIIDKLYYQFNELLDEKLFREINFVFVDILIRLKKPLKALILLQNLKFLNRRGSTASLQSPKADEKNEEKISELENDHDSQHYAELISLFKLKCYFMMNSWKPFEKELKQFFDLNGQKSPQLVHILNSQEYYLLNDQSNAFKSLLTHISSRLKLSNNSLIQQITDLVDNENKLSSLGSSTVSNDFYLNLSSICNSLTSSLTNTKGKINEDNVTNSYSTILFLNNLALIHFSLKKYSLSTFYFKKSLNENTKFVERYLQNPLNVTHPQNETKSKKKSKSKSTEPDKEEIDDPRLSKFLNLNENLMNNQYEIVYNLGISLLFNKQPLAAFECLFKLVDQYNQNARLWLRLAECCITCYRHSLNSDSFQFIKLNATLSGNERIFKLSEKIKCIKNSFGTGFHHKIQIGSVITPDVGLNGLTLSDFKNFDDEKMKSKMITLEFAYLCLKNAFSLIPTNQQIFTSDPVLNLKSSSSSRLTNQNENIDDDSDICDHETSYEPDNEGSPNSQKLKRNVHQKYFNCVYPSKPINLAELQNLRCSILVSLSYVSLCLRDYANTVKYCNLLLDQDDQLNSKFPISKGNKHLAHSYLAEALSYLDKISDSIEHLNVNAKLEQESDVSFVPSSVIETDSSETNDGFKNVIENRYKNHQAEWFPKDLSIIKAVSYFNLSVAHAIRGENETASKHFNNSVQIFDKHKKHPAQAFLMKMYLDLLDGSRQSLQMVLKDHFPHTTLNRPTLNMLNIGGISQNQKMQLQQLQLAQSQQHQMSSQQAQNQGQLPPNLAFLQLQQQQQQQQLQLQQQIQMQQIQHQLQQQHQIQQLQQPAQQSLLQSQNLNQFLNNPNNLLMSSFNGSNQASANLVGLPPALSPFNQPQNNLTSILGQSNNANGSGLGSAFGNLPNLNGANLLSTLAAAAAAAANNNTPGSSGSATVSQLGLLNQTQLSVNPLLLQQQQQQQQQPQGSNFLSQNQLQNRIS